MKSKVLIADDHAVIRAGLSMLINAEKDMEVVATANDGKEAYDKSLELKPDIVIMDLNMPPGEDGLSATTRLKKALPDVEILVLTMHEDQEYLFSFLKAGASGYILKNSQEAEIIDAIRIVSKKEAYLSPQATKMIIQELLHPSTATPKGAELLNGLTTRECEVVPLIAKGHSNKEIADLLFISIKTVEAHKSKIMEKLELRTRAELVSYAIKQGYLDS
ncbi:MAG: response regulator transcription factor [Paenibacillaceae bacterium]